MLAKKEQGFKGFWYLLAMNLRDTFDIFVVFCLLMITFFYTKKNALVKNIITLCNWQTPMQVKYGCELRATLRNVLCLRWFPLTKCIVSALLDVSSWRSDYMNYGNSVSYFGSMGMIYCHASVTREYVASLQIAAPPAALICYRDASIYQHSDERRTLDKIEQSACKMDFIKFPFILIEPPLLGACVISR